ncbi:helix-turn-helix transcriptional regulator [Actinomycetospora chiangmaiensis]|uniref:helix-turn-helix transcriptional regulator n=1 Tax=Actinomycetospora chiangmaiensis TaxID=402650 RepID=UPI00039F1F14|nr:helix-turn-helix transcriptional regulator [Actinomycetospora chiangmaiensis]
MTRGGSEVPEEFGRALRRLRQAARMTQQALADALSVQRATISQWETGSHLPSQRNIDELDRLLDSDGELAGIAGAEHAPASPSTVSVYEVFRRIGRILVDELARNENGDPVGWRRDFGRRPASPLSTATGIRLLTLLETPFVDLAALGRSLARMEDPGGGWGARGFRHRPEVTALVMDALARIGGPVDLKRLLPVLTDQVDRRALGQVHVLTEVLRSVAPLRVDAGLTVEVVRALLDVRVGPGQWPEKQTGRAGIRPQPSMAHTARAVIALDTYRECGGKVENGEIGAALDAATEWLAAQEDRLYLVRENLEPSPDDPEYGDLEIRHFTGALVSQALLRCRPDAWTGIERAVATTWRHYVPDAGLWAWPNGDTPIWMQHEAVLAVTHHLQRRHHAPRSDPARSPDSEVQ